MLELKTIICDISNEYRMPPPQVEQLFDVIVQILDKKVNDENVDFM